MISYLSRSLHMYSKNIPLIYTFSCPLIDGIPHYNGIFNDGHFFGPPAVYIYIYIHELSAIIGFVIR